jgi:hypothetical protein
MFYERAIRLLTARRVLVVALSLSAAAGWGSFAVSSQSATEMERQLRGELGSLQEAQGKLLAEQSKMQAALSEMAQVRTDLAAARAEVARLSQLVGQVQPELPQLPPVRPGTRESSRTSATIDAVSRAGSIVTKASKQLAVKTASGDKPAPQDRDSQAAGKIAMPNSQKVAEKSHRSATPTIRPELDTASLRQLTKSAEAQAQE